MPIDGEPSKFGDQLGWAGIATVANLPSTAIPLGVNKAGLPLSVQAIGPFLEDKTTIAFAGMVGPRHRAAADRRTVTTFARPPSA